MKLLVTAVASLCVLAAAPSLAQEEAQSSADAEASNTGASAAADATPQESAKGDSGSKMKCKYQHVVGSRIPQRVCFTVDEWEEMRLKILEEARGMKNRNSHCPSEGPC